MDYQTVCIVQVRERFLWALISQFLLSTIGLDVHQIRLSKLHRKIQ